jgi:hypothetical protein
MRAARTKPGRRRFLVAAAGAALLLGFGLLGLAQAEVKQKGKVRVTFVGEFNPTALPRSGMAPIEVTVGGRIATTDGDLPPQLRKIEIAINRNGRLSTKGLPVCEVDDIQPATTANALEACGDSLVGKGSFAAKVLLPEQTPYPSSGTVYAFNGVADGHPAILAHVFGTNPVPTSFTLPFLIKRGRGTFATTLVASLPQVTSNSGFITGLEMTLHRNYSYRGHRYSYLSAGCPAPAGFPGAVFPLARASFGFQGKTLSQTLTRNCKARH